jgi:hypothetical protein
MTDRNGQRARRRDDYADVGRAMRYAIDRANEAGATDATMRVLTAVLYLTGTWSKLADNADLGTIAVLSGAWNGAPEDCPRSTRNRMGERLRWLAARDVILYRSGNNGHPGKPGVKSRVEVPKAPDGYTWRLATGTLSEGVTDDPTDTLSEGATDEVAPSERDTGTSFEGASDRSGTLSERQWHPQRGDLPRRNSEDSSSEEESRGVTTTEEERAGSSSQPPAPSPHVEGERSSSSSSNDNAGDTFWSALNRKRHPRRFDPRLEGTARSLADACADHDTRHGTTELDRLIRNVGTKNAAEDRHLLRELARNRKNQGVDTPDVPKLDPTERPIDTKLAAKMTSSKAENDRAVDVIRSRFGDLPPGARGITDAARRLATKARAAGTYADVLDDLTRLEADNAADLIEAALERARDRGLRVPTVDLRFARRQLEAAS